MKAAIAGSSVVLGADQTDHLAADEIHPLQPLESQIATEKSSCAGE